MYSTHNSSCRIPLCLSWRVQDRYTPLKLFRMLNHTHGQKHHSKHYLILPNAFLS